MEKSAMLLPSAVIGLLSASRILELERHIKRSAHHAPIFEPRLGAVVSYETTRGLICSIRAPRFDSAAVISFAVSFAVLRFEPHTTMPPKK